MKKKVIASAVIWIALVTAGCGNTAKTQIDRLPAVDETQIKQTVDSEGAVDADTKADTADSRQNEEAQEKPSQEDVEAEAEPEPQLPAVSSVEWDDNWEYADHSILHTDSVKLYRATDGERKNVIVTVNAGHGTAGGTSVKTLCHPDGSAKVTGGSTAEGAIKAIAVSSGTTMLDGTPEGKVTLSLAMLVKETLLSHGYDVLMIRETDDAQIDNVARTVYANNNSDCHIALHYNSTDYDAGFFYIGVPDIASYKAMEPVASHWKEHNAFGAALLEGEKQAGVKIYGDGFMGMDLTQTSYSTVPSVDVEVGDRGSSYEPAVQQKIADGILAGLDLYFGTQADSGIDAP